MDSRLPHYVYRCTTCHRVITRAQIMARWEALEKDYSSAGVCSCGGGKISPTNPTLWEELTNPHIWKLWWSEVAFPWLRGKK